MIARALLLLAVVAGAASAQEAGSLVQPCQDGPRVDTIAEPWEANTATYAQGAIRVARLDFVEPAAAAIMLLVLSPPHDELGLPQCRVVGFADGVGFGDIDFAARQASYDPARGLTLLMPARQPVADGDGDDGWFQLSVTVNQTSGEIDVQGFK